MLQMIAKELRHDNLIASIRKEIELLYNMGISLQKFLESTYVNPRGKVWHCYVLNDKGMLQMIAKELRHDTLMASIRKEIEVLKNLEIAELNFE